MKDVMFDLETLGVTPSAVILSVGAVKFDLDTGEIDDAGFYASISIDDQLSHDRKIDESTLIWWLGQSKEAQAVFHEPKQLLADVLDSLTEWLGHNKRCVWSNGADFDLPMLAHAYTSLGMTVPWQFWNSRCVRTYKNLPSADTLPKQVPGIKHNALHDALAQVRTVQAIQKMLRNGRKA